MGQEEGAPRDPHEGALRGGVQGARARLAEVSRRHRHRHRRRRGLRAAARGHLAVSALTDVVGPWFARARVACRLVCVMWCVCHVSCVSCVVCRVSCRVVCRVSCVVCRVVCRVSCVCVWCAACRVSRVTCPPTTPPWCWNENE